MNFNRIIIIVMDSVGAGDSRDAAAFGDAGADTLGHIDATVPGGLNIPHMRSMGMGEIANIHPDTSIEVVGSYGKMQEKAAGKDTTVSYTHLTLPTTERV